MLIIGTPSRRLAGTARRAHLVACKLDDLGTRITTLLRDHAIFTAEALTPGIRDATHGWLAIAKVSWMQVHEARPEVTHRRDTGTPASWLQDKRILVLGCGALGAPIAEHSVRAGARDVTVVDNGVVNPGILARQPYTYPDIGTPKATALSARLNTLTRTPTVTARVTDAVGLVTAPDFDPTIFDLIIDATADAGVRVALERTRIPRRAAWPRLATLVIGHRADRGVVCLSATGATGAGTTCCAVWRSGPMARSDQPGVTSPRTCTPTRRAAACSSPSRDAPPRPSSVPQHRSARSPPG